MQPTTPNVSTAPLALDSFPDGFRALVLGASGGIGQACVQALQAHPRCAVVLALHRRSQPALDLNIEASIAHAAQAIRASSPFHLVVHAAGVLHGAGFMPEKKLGDLNYAQLEATFRANTLGPALVLRHFTPLLDRQRSVLALLSAKVGSIGDNRLGGWYSYRASKAALNMLLKTAAIEMARTHPQAVLAALHPGTVDSALSAPFRGTKIWRSARDAAHDLLAVIDGLQPQDSGGFWAYDGQRLPW